MKPQFLLNILFITGFCFYGCQSNSTVQTKKAPHHWIEIKRPSIGILYVDSVPLRSVMKISSPQDAQNFKAYLVGINDSVVTSERIKQIEDQKYFEYEMQNDWSAMAGGVEYKPTFYQSKPNPVNLSKEGILLFETEDGKHPDMLIYADSHGSWGTQKFILTER